MADYQDRNSKVRMTRSVFEVVSNVDKRYILLKIKWMMAKVDRLGIPLVS